MAKPRLLRLLAILSLAGLTGFLVGSMGASPALACYEDEFTYDWCYEPFQCNDNPVTSFVRVGGSYEHFTFQSFPCPMCPGQYYDTEYGLDVCSRD